MLAKLFFSLALMASPLAGAQGIANESGDDLENFEEYGPVHDAFQEARQDSDSEFHDRVKDTGADFTHRVPEPIVKKHVLGRSKPSSSHKKIKISKHVHGKKHWKTIAKSGKHKKGRTLASVKKSLKNKKTLAKRGSSHRSALR